MKLKYKDSLLTSVIKLMRLSIDYIQNQIYTVFFICTNWEHINCKSLIGTVSQNNGVLVGKKELNIFSWGKFENYYLNHYSILFPKQLSWWKQYKRLFWYLKAKLLSRMTIVGLKAVSLNALRWPRFQLSLANVRNILSNRNRWKSFFHYFLHKKNYEV